MQNQCLPALFFNQQASNEKKGIWSLWYQYPYRQRHFYHNTGTELKRHHSKTWGLCYKRCLLFISLKTDANNVSLSGLDKWFTSSQIIQIHHWHPIPSPSKKILNHTENQITLRHLDLVCFFNYLHDSEGLFGSLCFWVIF